MKKATLLFVMVAIANSIEANADPIDPAFSIDPASSSINGNITPDDVLTTGPLIAIQGRDLGLQDNVFGGAFDNLADFSFGGDPIQGPLYFSVDRVSIGLPGTAVFAEAQSSVAAAAGDIFQALPPVGSNRLFINETQLGLQSGFFGDDIDGLELDTEPLPNTYFTIDRLSATNGLGAGDLASNILVSAGNGRFSVYAPTPMMGLQPAAAIDGLVLWDRNRDQIAEPGVDGALFSLDPFSPDTFLFTGLNYIPCAPGHLSPADICYTDFTGAYSLWASASAIGLRPDDNVDALDTIPEPGSLVLLGSGWMGLWFWRKRQNGYRSAKEAGWTRRDSHCALCRPITLLHERFSHLLILLVIFGLPLAGRAQDVFPNGPLFFGIAPPLAYSNGKLFLEADLMNRPNFEWMSSDSILGDIDTGVVTASTWTLTGVGPDRLIFVWSGADTTIYGNVLFEPYNRAVVDIVKGAKRVRYLLTLAPPSPSPPPQIVVVVPGILGSVLLKPSDGEQVWMRVSQEALKNLEYPKIVNVKDIARKYDFEAADNNRFERLIGNLKNGQIYNPLIEELKKEGFKPEYDFRNGQYNKMDGRPERITKAGCKIPDENQQKPKLFIFPYDWRQPNKITAAYLKEYIEDCIINKIYHKAGIKVDIVAHSMGGLVARRMILDTMEPKKNHPLVRKLITLGTPFWGAPRANYKMERGDFFTLPRLNRLFGNNSFNQTVKQIMNGFPALHELLPSKALFDNTPANQKPFGEGSPPLLFAESFRYWDINQSKKQELDYEYIDVKTNGYKELMNNIRFADKKPMDANESFHSYPKNNNQQDNWKGDETGVTYYHIIGVGKHTPVKIKAKLLLGIRQKLGPKLQLALGEDGQIIYPVDGEGDGAVPRKSAERTALSNAFSDDKVRKDNMRVLKDIEHTELVQKPAPLNCVLKFLDVNKPCPDGEPLFQASLLPPSRRIDLVNVESVAVFDAAGDPIEGIDDSPVRALYGDTSSFLTLSTNQEASITFRTLADPEASSMIQVMTTDDSETNIRKIVYLDPQTRFDRPPEPVEEMLGQLYVDSQGNTTLQFDWNGDGIIDDQDDVMPPTVDTINPAVVSDELGPTIEVSGIRTGADGTRYVTLTAIDPSDLLPDTGIGTPPFLVSLDNNGEVIDNLAKYTMGTEFAVPADKTELTGCAVDGAGNRSCELFEIP